MYNKEKLIDELEKFGENAQLSNSDKKKVNTIKEYLLDVKEVRQMVQMDSLSAKEKIQLIITFEECYENSGKEIGAFAEEFFWVTDQITSNRIPIELQFIDDFLKYMVDIVPSLAEKLEEMNIEW